MQKKSFLNSTVKRRYLKIMKVETTIIIEADLLEQVEVAAKTSHETHEIHERFCS